MTVEFMPTDTVLVTGGHGMLGGEIARQLREQTQACVLTPSRTELDLIDGVSVNQWFDRERPIHVFHSAAKVFGLGGNMKFPGDMYYQNAVMNLNVVEAARRVGCRKVTAVGTGAVYPVKFDGRTLTEDMIWDGEPHDTEWAYAQAKRGMLAQLMAYEKQFGMSWAYAVCANLYGPRDLYNIDYGHVIPSLVAKFYRAALDRTPVSVWGTGAAVRDFSFVEDAAAAIIAAHRQLGGAVNIASGHIHKIRDIVDLLMEFTDGAVEVQWDTTKPDGQARRFYSLDRLNSIGFTPAYDLRAGLRKTWDWYCAAYPDIRI